MDVRVYREKPLQRDVGRALPAASRSNAAPGAPKRSAQALWEYLLAQSQRR